MYEDAAGFSGFSNNAAKEISCSEPDGVTTMSATRIKCVLWMVKLICYIKN